MAEQVPSAARSPLPFGLPWAVGLLVLAAIAAFAIAGPYTLEGRLALALLPASVLLALPAISRVWIVPLVVLTTLFGLTDSRYYLFEPFVFVGAALALRKLWQARDRSAWDLRAPAYLALLYLAAPLLALLGEVGSLVSFLGPYRLCVIWVVVFFSLRRLVSQKQSDVLLWTFPILGLAAALQLAQRTAGLGALLTTRMMFRNFYTELPWGKSNYVSSVLEFCLCMCVVLWFLDRRPAIRAILAGAAILMFQSFLSLTSRAGALGLGVFALILLLGLTNRRTNVIALGSVAAVVFGLLTSAGQSLLQRFSDPTEYASWYQRVLLWQFGWQRFLAQPFIGTGLNQGRYVGDPLGSQSAHNLFLDALADQGILGGIALLAILVAAYRLCTRVEPYHPPSSLRAVRVACIATLSEIVVHGMFEPVINNPPNALLLVLFFVWLCLNDSKRSGPVRIAPQPPSVPLPQRTTRTPH